MSFTNAVLHHLEDVGSITPGEAILIYSKTNGLAQRICDLRKRGHIIRTERKVDQAGGSYCRYVMD